MPLSTTDQGTIDALSRSDVETTMIGLRPFLEQSRWIADNNAYAHDAVSRINSNPPNDPAKKQDLAQYISASAALHANDGWSYLGRSISCLMVGDAHRALHLAYYAELRAGMSLLAGQGIGIFNNKHFAVNAPNVTTKLNASQGTHMVVWEALEYWSKQPASGSLFSRLIRPEGIALDDWFAPIGGGSALAAQARDWFLQWGMDLSLATNDRQARNESSYRPDGIPLSWEVSSTEVLDFVKELWRSLEPTAESSFDQIDRYILRLTLDKHYAGISGEAASANNPGFVSYVASVVAAQSLSVSATTRWEGFLLRRTDTVDPIIFANSTKMPASVSSDPLSVLSRATLLLRVATGSAHDLMKGAGLDASALTFWWKGIGVARGLWSPSSQPEQLSDLWADIRDTLQDVDAKSASDPSAYSSISGLGYGQAESLNMLCSHERVSLWGLCPV